MYLFACREEISDNGESVVDLSDSEYGDHSDFDSPSAQDIRQSKH